MFLGDLGRRPSDVRASEGRNRVDGDLGGCKALNARRQDSYFMRLPRKEPLFVVFCVILAV